MKNEKIAIVRSFNSDFFNFLKIHPREIVAKVALSPSDCRVAAVADKHASDAGEAAALPGGLAGATATVDGTVLHRLVVNSSPLYRSHCLLVLEAEEKHPQVLTAPAIAYAARLLTLAGSRPDLCVGFNSLGAWASVNHLHMHVFFAGADMFAGGVCPVQNARMEQVGEASDGVTAWRTVDYPLTSWAFTLMPGSPSHALHESVSGEGPGPSWTSNLAEHPAARLAGAVLHAKPPKQSEVKAANLEDHLCPLLPGASGGLRGFASTEGATEMPAETVAGMDRLSAAAGSLVRWCLLHGVPHNVLVADKGRTVYVIPRRVQQNLNDSQLNIAIAESIGLPVATTAAMFEKATPEYLDEVYGHFCVSPSTASAVDAHVEETLSTGIAGLLPLPSVADAVAEVQAAVEAEDAPDRLPEGFAIDGKRLLLEGVVGEEPVELFG